MNKKKQAFRLFSEGKRPSDPEVKALGLANKTLYNYFQFFKKDVGQKLPKGGEDSRAKTTVMPKASSLSEAATLFIIPRKFEMSSLLLWQAMEVAINEWGWPRDITPEDFLDTYLYQTMKQRGIILGAYKVVDEEKGQIG